MSETAISPGAIVLVDFPFAGGRGAKRRPALVVSGEAFHAQRGDYVVVAISSRPALDGFDLPITRWREVGLYLPSVLRLGQVLTLDAFTVVAVLGNLPATDLARIRMALGRVFE